MTEVDLELVETLLPPPRFKTVELIGQVASRESCLSCDQLS